MTTKEEGKLKGEFIKKDSCFRQWIKGDGSSEFPPEADRYHLFVSLACPWAHRTLVVRGKFFRHLVIIEFLALFAGAFCLFQS